MAIITFDTHDTHMNLRATKRPFRYVHLMGNEYKNKTGKSSCPNG